MDSDWTIIQVQQEKQTGCVRGGRGGTAVTCVVGGCNASCIDIELGIAYGKKVWRGQTIGNRPAMKERVSRVSDG